MFIERKKITPDFAKRSFLVANILTILSLLGIFFAYWNMQVIHFEYYQDLSLRNIEKTVDLAPPRGLILDRRGQVLAENTLNFTLFLIRENMRDIQKTLKVASFLTDKDEGQIKEILQRFDKYPKSYMIPIKSNLPLARVSYIESREDEFPEFKIEVQPQRAYPNGNTASHILGYISEITDEELRKHKDGSYKMGDVIGVTGIERVYDGYLKGRRGARTLIKDFQEKVQRIDSERKPRIGGTLVLSLDLELQKYTEEVLGQEKGAVGVADLETGGILVMVSKPDFNPVTFAHALDIDTWKNLINAPEKPLQNKFIQGLYAPGSVFKIVMALAALQEKVIDANTTFFCSGAISIYDRFFHCWLEGGHGYVNVVEALEKSCNVFFYNLGKRLDINVIARYAQLLGLGDTDLIDLPNENRGIIPTPQWKMNALGQKWFSGETISVAIGEGSLSVTPLQVLKMISTVALRGKQVDFHVLDKVKHGDQVIFQYEPRLAGVSIDKSCFDLVIEGIFRVVNGEGTAGLARVEGLDICGKTGTSQIISKENPHYQQLVKKKEFMPNSWFVSFAPRDNPRIAMVVLVENGGDAGRMAAPIAARIYRKYFNNEGLR